MPRCQHLPRFWLMTDERQGERLWMALSRLPRGGGVVFRHYALAPRERLALFVRVRRLARRRGLVLVSAAAFPGRADGRHNARGPGLRTRSAHNVRELVAARNADLVFLSPVHPTRSHPHMRSLGRVRFGLLLRQASVPVIALGGMDARSGRTVMHMGAYGWAAVDAWSRYDHASGLTGHRKPGIRSGKPSRYR